MSGRFYDSSALAKAYRVEDGSKAVVAMLSDPTLTNFISSLTVVEFQSVFAQKVRAGQLSLADFEFVRRKFGGEIRARRLVVKGTLRRHQRVAERLIVSHGPTHRLRTLDALQLALAIELATTNVATTMVVADKILVQIARLEGLHVVEPHDA